jgi:secondary thiamine-phosphate synthase enzyme
LEKISIHTQKSREVVDITQLITEALKRLTLQDGVVHLFVLHTTAALGIADLDPGTDLDMLDAFEAMIPKLRYRHPHDPGHVPEHILSTLQGVSLTVPISKQKPVLGTWQRIVLFEFSGPRERQIMITKI